MVGTRIEVPALFIAAIALAVLTPRKQWIVSRP
jgi:hypothetical protein